MIYRFRHIIARKRLHGMSFSIISNNCWGAHIYQNLRMPYKTPFVGLYLSPTSYLTLLKNFQKLMPTPLKFKSVSDEPSINVDRQANSYQWPIGCLGEGVEIQFLHYRSNAEALERWQRRCARLVYPVEQFFFKLDDRAGCTKEQMTAFTQLPFKNKVLFTTRKDVPGDCVVRIPLAQTCVPDGVELSHISPRFFDAADWLSGGRGHPKPLSGWLNCL